MAGGFTPKQHFGFEGGGLVLALRGRGLAMFLFSFIYVAPSRGRPPLRMSAKK